jgi:hypothetical protein
MQRFAFFSLLAVALIVHACQNSGQQPTDGIQPSGTAAAPQGIMSKDSLAKRVYGTNPWINNTCELVTDAEFYALMNVDVKRDFANRFTLDAKENKAYCLRTWKKPDWREREVLEAKNPKLAANPESMLAIEVINLLDTAVANAQYAEYLKIKKRGLGEVVPGLGDGALWSDSETLLYFNKGHLNFQVQLNMFDQAHDNLPKAIEVGKLMLQKVK